METPLATLKRLVDDTTADIDKSPAQLIAELAFWRDVSMAQHEVVHEARELLDRGADFERTPGAATVPLDGYNLLVAACKGFKVWIWRGVPMTRAWEVATTEEAQPAADDNDVPF